MKHKYTISIFIIIYLIINSIIYYSSEIEKQKKINKAIDNHTDKLLTHYEIILHHQTQIADSIYGRTINNEKVINLLSQIDNSSKKEIDAIRLKLKNLLQSSYNLMKNRGVLQYHFILPNNESFLRMHKPSKYGDDLSDVRVDIKTVNETKKIVRGFDQGRTAHGFRNVYPIFGNNEEYLCAIEISYGSEILQDNLNTISKLHTHFLVDKSIFNSKAWSRDDMVLKYTQSAEHKNYMMTLTQKHTKEKCIVQNKKRLLVIRKDIDKKIKLGKKFGTYMIDEKINKTIVLAFIPIKNIRDNKVVAWLVSYEKDEFIQNAISNSNMLKIVLALITLILFYFIYRVVIQKDILNEQVKIKTKELNNLNQNLKNKIKEEVQKNKDIQEQLFKSEKMASMGEMIGNIAHQWRQPLSVISTAATGVKMQQEYGVLCDNDLFKACDNINENAQYLSKTIDDFRNFIKGDRDKKEFNLKDNIESFLHIVQSSITNHNLNVQLNLDNNIKINGYENELIQCYINLFNNAKDLLVTKDNQKRLIFINTTRDEKHIIIQFIDNGGGIQEDIIKKVFEPYFTTKHQSQGTGLGLHMVYNLVVSGMDGAIDVKNHTYTFEGEEYKGAMFTIKLPIK